MTNQIMVVDARGDEMQGHLTPDRILESGFGFRDATTLLAGVDLGVFSELA